MTRTTTGKLYETKMLRRHGSGVAGTQDWEIVSAEDLTQEDVTEVIESIFPFAGYGSSGFRRMPKSDGFFRIVVTSNASCD